MPHQHLPVLADGVADHAPSPVVQGGEEALEHDRDIGVCRDLQLVPTQLGQHRREEQLTVWCQIIPA